ncbi:membrane protein insertion efficiency factor YidD [Pseudonocardiaceae bacterium YIM PH 21723]|nr:membrane protein insertion efficiency factor YidD [Pseudonocardiaceae bacterium YIM PH 21723]
MAKKNEDWRKAMRAARKDSGGDRYTRGRWCDSSTSGSGGNSGDASGASFFRLRPSDALLLASRVLRGRLGTLIAVSGIRGYQRLLTRFTGECPETVSCSAYTLDAVNRLGAHRGLRLGALRLRACGPATA